jgi:hypothetical protein
MSFSFSSRSFALARRSATPAAKRTLGLLDGRRFIAEERVQRTREQELQAFVACEGLCAEGQALEGRGAVVLREQTPRRLFEVRTPLGLPDLLEPLDAVEIRLQALVPFQSMDQGEVEPGLASTFAVRRLPRPEPRR